MLDKVADSTARLEQLLKQIMKEKDPARYDALASEIWSVLQELERLRNIAAPPIAFIFDFPNTI